MTASPRLDSSEKSSILTRLPRASTAVCVGGGRFFGGGRESRNLVAMLARVNRSGPNSYHALETHWRTLLKQDPDTLIAVDIRPRYSGASPVPDRVTVEYKINGVEQSPKVFKNV
jgi:DNA/RNA non-specific endonuclease